MKLTAWIDVNGGTAPTAALLGIERNVVYAWKNAIALPRPEMMVRLVKFTRGKVSYAEMIEDHVLKRVKKARPYVKKPKKVFKPKKAPKQVKGATGVGRGYNSPPSVMKRVIEARAKVKKATKKNDPGF